MTQLTRTQAILIANAGSRADDALLPATEGITGKTLDRTLDALFTKGLVSRTFPDGDKTAEAAIYVLTDARRAAVVPDSPRVAMKVAAAPDRPSGKLGVVLKAVERRWGATISELTEVTGWQPHTARAALTRLRQRGFPAVLSEDGGRKAYRLQG
jgi:DNA-binding MarR family transcriptional regulator